MGRLFPGHEFYMLPTTRESVSYPDRFPYPGFTSVELTSGHEQAPPESARALVVRAAQEALGDRRRAAADLVLVVDDIELENAAQPERVVAVMRKAVEVHLSGLGQAQVQDKTRQRLRDRVSFHLLAPMIEAWFFADRRALTRAGVPAEATVCFDEATDPEAFETADGRYLNATEADCPTLAALPLQKKKKLRPKWLGVLPRERHPKGYLQWLCRVPNARSCTGYSESEDGGAALANIRWEVLFARADTHFGFLRALVEDLEDGLGCPSALGPVVGAVSRLTARSNAPRDAVLRNI
ncbi:hypothetical protein [Haliangium sp.]|uniref:hypothetical protein n=1 Tax=Haliangium sp. TaxID=2663208 RepID=UPI003D0BEC91